MADGDVNGGVSHDLSALLSSDQRDFLVRNNGDQVKISGLSGKVVAMYFSGSWCGPCRRFTPKLIEVYQEVVSKGDFEVVFVSSDRDEESFNGYFSEMPWLAIPFSDSDTRKRLKELFQVRGIPNLVVIDSNGKVATLDGTVVVMEHGVDGYPFTRERINFLKEEEEAAKRNQTLSSILVSRSRNYLVSNNGNQVPVSELVGKNVLLYFSAHWCPPCRGFTPKLIKTYHDIKAKDNEFEVIFISSDRNQSSFDEYYSSMPWLALPYGDERKKLLDRRFKIEGIPTAIAIGPSGRTVTKEARDLIGVHGADAYPFTEEHLKHLEEQAKEIAKGWPEKLKHELHDEHELVLTRRNTYYCDACDELGHGWSFYCGECDFDLHPKCALEKKEEAKDEPTAAEGFVCEGDVCRRV